MHRETVSPQKAIMIGLVTVNIPVLIIMLGVGVCLFQLSFHKLIHPLVFLPGGIIIAPLVAWVNWSFAITYWRIWAFSRSNEMVELKRMAIASGLIWADGSFFERTEIRTAKQKALIEELEIKIRKEQNKK